MCKHESNNTYNITTNTKDNKHDDVIKWKHFPRYWPFVWGIHRSPVNSPYNGQWRGALMFSLICVCINGWVNNRETGDLRRHRAHCDVTVMIRSAYFMVYIIYTCVIFNIMCINALLFCHCNSFSADQMGRETDYIKQYWIRYSVPLYRKQPMSIETFNPWTGLNWREANNCWHRWWDEYPYMSLFFMGLLQIRYIPLKITSSSNLAKSLLPMTYLLAAHSHWNFVRSTTDIDEQVFARVEV